MIYIIITNVFIQTYVVTQLKRLMCLFTDSNNPVAVDYKSQH